jgi:hypothetical protein
MSQPRTTKVQQWTDRFERFQHARGTLAQFCRDEGVSLPSFYQWRKRIYGNPASRAVQQPLINSERSAGQRSTVRAGQRSAAKCEADQYGAAQGLAGQRSAAKCEADQYGAAQGLAGQCNAAKCKAGQRGVVQADESLLRITIESAGTVIRCHCDSLQAIETVLSWANRQRESRFRQLDVRS